MGTQYCTQNTHIIDMGFYSTTNSISINITITITITIY